MSTQQNAGGMFSPGQTAAPAAVPAPMGMAIPVVIMANGQEVTVDVLFAPEHVVNARQIIEGMMQQGHRVKGYAPRDSGGGGGYNSQGGGGGGYGGGYNRGGGYGRGRY